jgi:hypothetical protein
VSVSLATQSVGLYDFLQYQCIDAVSAYKVCFTDDHALFMLSVTVLLEMSRSQFASVSIVKVSYVVIVFVCLFMHVRPFVTANPPFSLCLSAVFFSLFFLFYFVDILVHFDFRFFHALLSRYLPLFRFILA